MRTIPEIVAQMRELIEELEQHTGKPAPKQEIPGLDFPLYNHDYNYMGGSFQATDTISLTGAAGLPAFTVADLNSNPADISFNIGKS